MANRLGLLTIGTSPRPDGLARDVQAVLGDAEVLERGALDGLSNEAIAALAPGPQDDTLVTLRGDGQSVTIGKKGLLPYLQQQIDAFEQQDGVSAILLMCTGAFPPFRHEVPLIAPQEALYACVTVTAGPGGVVGSLTPLPTQVEAAQRKWKKAGHENAVVEPADPYAADAAAQVEAAAKRARERGAHALFMDCFGYDRALRETAKEAFQGPIVLARSMAARLAREVM